METSELGAFLAGERKVVCATLGPRGLPHVVALGFALLDGRVWCWSYAKAQKVRNLERDPRATLLFEAGDSYRDYRGAMLECDVRIHRGEGDVRRVGWALAARYDPDAIRHAIDAQAAKRVALEFVVRRQSSYDHRMLPAGVY
ncbi:MAG TPA: pyridoxamine 5'-phosphate oxidase family protein [Solirubrobacteraceae bacterium]